MVEMVGFCQVFLLVMLETAKDQILGVTRYGMACLLIRDDVGGVPCLDESEV
jgi:hypothetical protein